MDPIQLLCFPHLTSRKVDQRELQQRLELRFARREETRSIRRRRRQRFVQLLSGPRRSRSAPVTLTPRVAQ
jgi:hypothetical protein